MNATGLVATLPDGTHPPGARAAFVALVLAIVGFSFIFFTPLVRTDDRGEPVPTQFEGLYLEARSCLEALSDGLACSEGEQVEVTEETYVGANGLSAVWVFVVPVAMTAVSWYMHRKTGLSRPLTVGMLALAFVVLFTGFFFIPAVIALAVGSFQARRAEIPARLAERAVGRADEHEGEDDVIDVEATEVDVTDEAEDEDVDAAEDVEDEEDTSRQNGSR